MRRKSDLSQEFILSSKFIDKERVQIRVTDVCTGEQTVLVWKFRNVTSTIKKVTIGNDTIITDAEEVSIDDRDSLEE